MGQRENNKSYIIINQEGINLLSGTDDKWDTGTASKTHMLNISAVSRRCDNAAEYKRSVMGE